MYDLVQITIAERLLSETDFFDIVSSPYWGICDTLKVPTTVVDVRVFQSEGEGVLNN